MNDSSNPSGNTVANPHRETASYLVPLLLLSTLILSFSIWANLSWEVQDPTYFQYFPPFRAGVDRNMNKHLGAEYLSIAQAIVKGRGFSDPFQVESGPTAWMPPILCWIEAFFVWIFQGDLELVMVAMVVLQNIALIAATWLVLALGGTSRIWTCVVLVTQLILQFRYAFQMTHDCGYLMLIMVGLIAGLTKGQPFSSLKRSLAWGAFGGLATLSSPVIGFVWLVTSFLQSKGRWTRLICALGVMGLLLAPWTIRNYVVFGKFIPVKSNLVYELYQTQCLQDHGVLNPAIFGTHPWGNNNAARRDYVIQGEMEFLNKKKEIFLEALKKDPLNFMGRVGERALGVTLVYQAENLYLEQESPFMLLMTYLIYTLPFVGWCLLLVQWFRGGLSESESVVFWVYLLYFLPYIVISYYSRYEFPAHPVKWILIVWLGNYAWQMVCSFFPFLRKGERDLVSP